jgi:hypothetical protein
LLRSPDGALGSCLRQAEGLAGALLFITPIANAGGSAPTSTQARSRAASAEQPMQSPGWTRCDVTAGVPQDADTLMFGLMMVGMGAAWFGDLVFAPL